MTAWAAGSKPRERQRVTPPAFVLASDLLPYQSDWNRALAQAESLVERAAPVLGFAPRVRLASMAMHPGEDAGEHGLDRVLDNEAAGGAREIFVLPASLDWNLWQREAFGRTLAEFRRCYGNTAVFHDDVDPCHPLVVECFADIFARALAGHQVPPHRLGLLLVASGHGDSGSRSQSYRLMRLLWERLSLARADVAFLRHAQEFLGTALERAAREPLDWVLVPQMQWHTEHFAYARTILENFQRVHPEAAAWPVAAPPGDHPSLNAWVVQRMTRLWQERRSREAVRTPSR